MFVDDEDKKEGNILVLDESFSCISAVELKLRKYGTHFFYSQFTVHIQDVIERFIQDVVPILYLCCNSVLFAILCYNFLEIVLITVLYLYPYSCSCIINSQFIHHLDFLELESMFLFFFFGKLQITSLEFGSVQILYPEILEFEFYLLKFGVFRF